MNSIVSTLLIAFISVVVISETTNADLNDEIYETEIESERDPRDTRIKPPGTNKLPNPPISFCFKKPCRILAISKPPGLRPTPREGIRHKRSYPTDFEETYKTEIESQRVPRDTNTPSRKSNKPRIPSCRERRCRIARSLKPSSGGFKPQTGGFKPSTGGVRPPTGFNPSHYPTGGIRHRRSQPLDIEETYETEIESPRVPRGTRNPSGGSSRLPYPNIPTCHRKQCRVARSLTPSSKGFQPPTEGFKPSSGGFKPPTGGFGPPSGGFRPGNEELKPPTGGFRPHTEGFKPLHTHYPSGGVRHRRSEPLNFEEERVRRAAVDDKGFKDFTPQSNTRGSIHSSKSFGPQSHGGLVSTAKIEHDFWKSNDGNTRIYGNAQHSRVDGGRYDGFKDNKVGIGLEQKFR